jgi:hypothetical protein
VHARIAGELFCGHEVEFSHLPSWVVMRKIEAVYLVISVILATSCSAGDSAPSASGSLRGEKRAGKKADSSVGGKNKPAEKADSGNGADPAGAVRRDYGNEDAIEKTRTNLAGMSLVRDASDDSQNTGDTPAYSEILFASLEARGHGLHMTLGFASGLPETMPDKTAFMIVTFGLTGEKENRGYSFGAKGNRDGWRPYSGPDPRKGDFRGRFRVAGNRIVITVPLSELGGERALQWQASSIWFNSEGRQRNTSFDIAPNQGPATFPS